MEVAESYYQPLGAHTFLSGGEAGPSSSSELATLDKGKGKESEGSIDDDIFGILWKSEENLEIEPIVAGILEGGTHQDELDPLAQLTRALEKITLEADAIS